MSDHSSVPISTVHVPYRWEYANASARTGSSGHLEADEGKLARQLDDNSLWLLTDYTGPTWVAVGGGGGGSSAWTDIENLDVDTGTEAVDSFAVTSDGMAVWEVFVGKDGNMRQHTFKAAWDYSENDITAQSDDSTIDIGDTSDLVLSLSMSGGTITFSATAATDNWVVKGKRMSVAL
jgi:hypothetical protein